MEFNKDEASAIQTIAGELTQLAFRELDEAELTLIGGGTGDVTLG